MQNVSTADGAGIQQWDWVSGDNQKWWFSDQGAARGVAAATGAATHTIAPRFYPNPVANTLTYQLPAGVKAHRVSILDLTGRQVRSQAYDNVGEQNTLDLTTLKRGLYLVRLSGVGVISQFKISKQ